MSLKIYEYANCGTCRKALKFLAAHKTDFVRIPIREQPPTKSELQQMLAHYHGEVRKLFNTSGRDYQAMQLKDRLSKMTVDEALDLLANNGNLVKRPFVLTQQHGLVGFKENEWAALFK